MTFWQHLSLIGNSVGDRKAIELWQMIEYKILNTEGPPPSLEINLQPLGLWKHTNDLKKSDDLEKDLRQKLANGCTSSIKTTLNSEMHDNSTCSWRVLSCSSYCYSLARILFSCSIFPPCFLHFHKVKIVSCIELNPFDSNH